MADQMIDSTYYYLPTELLIDIFLNLPVKTLIRCTSVCKSWYAIIRNPNFINSHTNSTANHRKNHRHDGYLLFGNPNFSHVVCDRTFESLYAIETPFAIRPHRKSSLNFIGSCDGLICLAPGLEYNLGTDVYIWNPSIRIRKKLPPSPFSDEFTDDRWIVSRRLAFGFCKLTNDYKVIRLVYFPDGRNFTSVDVPPLVEIYSLRSDSWRMIRTEVPPIVTQSVVTFHEGVFYWIGFKSIRDDPMENYIMSFDLGDERFREIEQPCVDFPFSLLAVRGSSSGSLYAVYSRFFGGQNDVLVLWRMDECDKSGWRKAYTIECVRGVWWTIGFTKSGKFVYLNLEKKVVSFDLESGKSEICDLGISFSRSAIDVGYMESLMLFDGSM